MKEAITAVTTATVTYAVRETTIGDKEIHEGDILGMLNDSIAVVGKDIAESAKELLAELVTDESEMISVYYGADVNRKRMRKLWRRISKKRIPTAKWNCRSADSRCITISFLWNKNRQT
ncbi:MAG: hypothetical protein V8Q36_10180 [Anaerotignum sp.]